jgi:hypothetical protein
MEKPVPSPDQILDLYDELGRPSATKFQIALKRRLGFNVSVEEVQRIVGLQSERQVLAPPPKFEGKVFSLGIDDKWVAVVVGFTGRVVRDTRPGGPGRIFQITLGRAYAKPGSGYGTDAKDHANETSSVALY